MQDRGGERGSQIKILGTGVYVYLASAAVCSDLVEVRTGHVNSAHDQVGADLALVPEKGLVENSYKITKYGKTTPYLQRSKKFLLNCACPTSNYPAPIGWYRYSRYRYSRFGLGSNPPPPPHQHLRA